MNLRLSLTALAVIALTIYSGVLQGKISRRWESPQASDIRLSSIPKQIGPWTQIGEKQISDDVLELLQADDSIHRVYEHEDGNSISVAVIAGPHGPVSVHIPEICYSSQDYQQLTQRSHKSVGDEDECWSLKFLTNDVHSAPMAVCYAWSDGQQWQAPESPRQFFAGSDRLFKIQVAAYIPQDDRGETADPAAQFVSDFAKIWPLDTPEQH